MNQIICTSSSSLEVRNKDFKKRNFYKIIFYILSMISFFSFLYYLYFRYSLYNLEKVSKGILNSFGITSLYKSDSTYNVNFVSSEISLQGHDNISVIGILEIKKLDITYPILSDISKEALRISPCRFNGPMPNMPGNLCIAAHNYKNGTFFSNLSDLKNGDIITIYDRNGNSVQYVVYDVLNSNANDLSSTNQNTDNQKVITLVTCYTLDNSFRTIVKAKEI